MFKKLLTILFSIFFLLFLTPSLIFAKRGCCSHHGGVCGCNTSVGRQVCCDGTYSPSCMCAYIAPKPLPRVVLPTPRPTIKPTPSSHPVPMSKKQETKEFPWLMAGGTGYLGWCIIKLKE